MIGAADLEGARLAVQGVEVGIQQQGHPVQHLLQLGDAQRGLGLLQSSRHHITQAVCKPHLAIVRQFFREQGCCQAPMHGQVSDVRCSNRDWLLKSCTVSSPYMAQVPAGQMLLMLQKLTSNRKKVGLLLNGSDAYCRQRLTQPRSSCSQDPELCMQSRLKQYLTMQGSEIRVEATDMSVVLKPDDRVKY